MDIIFSLKPVFWLWNNQHQLLAVLFVLAGMPLIFRPLLLLPILGFVIHLRRVNKKGNPKTFSKTIIPLLLTALTLYMIADVLGLIGGAILLILAFGAIQGLG